MSALEFSVAAYSRRGRDRATRGDESYSLALPVSRDNSFRFTLTLGTEDRVLLEGIDAGLGVILPEL